MPQRSLPSHRARSRVVVIGAGNAGISLSARLRRLGFEHVTICDARAEHRYRPLLSYVGAGLVDAASIARPMSAVIPDGVDHVHEAVAAVDTGTRAVTTSGGQVVEYDTLVIATGLLPRLEAVPGLSSAYAAGWAMSTFVDETAPRVWDAVRAIRGGTVVFSVPPEPAPCAATALKPFFMACDTWQKTGVLERLAVHLVLPQDAPLPAAPAQANTHLEQRMRELGVHVHRSSRIEAVDHEARTVTVASGDGESVLEDVGLPHVVPPYTAPEWIAEAGLAGAHAGQVDVDPETLRHPRHPDIWALGDVADLGTPPSGGALRRQVEVLAHNLSVEAGDPLRRYDGYTVMPVTLDRRRLLLVEVDRRGDPAPTAPLVDTTKPRRSTWLFDRYGLPQVYFRRILRGRV